jgi:hypothetical protein
MMMLDQLPGSLLGPICFQMLAESCWFMVVCWCLHPSLYPVCAGVKSLVVCVQVVTKIVMASCVNVIVKFAMACCAQGSACFKC